MAKKLNLKKNYGSPALMNLMGTNTPRKARIVVTTSKKKRGYRTPKTPKTSGFGWGM